MVEQMQAYNRNKSILGEGLQAHFERGSSSNNAPPPPLRIITEPTNPNHNNPFPRVDFPRFEVHLNGKTDLWFQGFVEGADLPTWAQFITAVLEMSNEHNPDMIFGDFNKLQQAGNVASYLERVKGYINHKDIQVLIDGGKTHCFLDETTATQLGCTFEYTIPMMVSVPDGSKMVSRTISPDFTWTIQGPYAHTKHKDATQMVQERSKMNQLLKENLEQAQYRMKYYADRGTSEREFNEGDNVYLKL
ncbi:hypothetical protein BUALT_Bualt18G0134600 [Buddleja alternifolia]|uniref:Uncharacterized protein n=1 Tax=Buddleja alternifolia TaxID=168488 RepID=A0AAV6WB96_9LAMI|nr:hypothetical protein BUALT_Bualt18G0134600 [Buddleja alternifolia]